MFEFPPAGGNFNSRVSLNTSSVTDMSSMFKYAYKYQGRGLKTFDTSNVQSFDSMFSYALEVNEPIATWNTASATSMNAMFYYAQAFSRDISKWVVSNVRQLDSTFALVRNVRDNVYCGTTHSSSPTGNRVQFRFVKLEHVSSDVTF